MKKLVVIILVCVCAIRAAFCQQVDIPDEFIGKSMFRWIDAPSGFADGQLIDLGVSAKIGPLSGSGSGFIFGKSYVQRSLECADKRFENVFEIYDNKTAAANGETVELYYRVLVKNHSVIFQLVYVRVKNETYNHGPARMPDFVFG